MQYVQPIITINDEGVETLFTCEHVIQGKFFLKFKSKTQKEKWYAMEVGRICTVCEFINDLLMGATESTLQLVDAQMAVFMRMTLNKDEELDGQIPIIGVPGYTAVSINFVEPFG